MKLIGQDMSPPRSEPNDFHIQVLSVTAALSPSMNPNEYLVQLINRCALANDRRRGVRVLFNSG
jgi:hypothetical protein